jgi:hypothetical protein
MDRTTNDEFYNETEQVIKFLTRDVANRGTFSGVAKSRALEVSCSKLRVNRILE